MSHHNDHEFDQYAEQYRNILDNGLHATRETSEYYARLKIEKLAQWLPEAVNQKLHILDFGCGDGMMTHYLGEKFKNSIVVGVDPSAKSIDVAQKKYGSTSLTFAVSDTKIPFEDHAFDIICTASVLHHISFSEHKHYLDEIFRVLKPGGTFIMFELNPLNPGTQYVFNTNPIDKNARMLTPWYAKKMLSGYGATRTNFYAFFPGFLRWFRFLDPILIKVPLGGLYACLITKK